MNIRVRIWDSQCFEVLWQLVEVFALNQDEILDGHKTVLDDSCASSRVNANTPKGNTESRCVCCHLVETLGSEF